MRRFIPFFFAWAAFGLAFALALSQLFGNRVQIPVHQLGLLCWKLTGYTDSIAGTVSRALFAQSAAKHKADGAAVRPLGVA